MKIAGKVVVLTGASEGIGLATARLFANLGARLALAARSAEKLNKLAAELPDAIALPTDMCDEQAVRQMIAQANDHYGRIDVLINNAGQGLHTPIADTDLGLYRAVFELNVVSVLNAMQAVIPIMRKQPEGGVIVNISSGTTRMTLPGVGPYASTKHALNAISLTARQELALERIRVCLVYPAITATGFHQHLANLQGQTQPGASTGWRPPGGGSGGIQIDTPEVVAETIREAVETEAAEVFAPGLKNRRPPA